MPFVPLAPPSPPPSLSLADQADNSFFSSLYSWLGKEPAKLPNLSADILARHGEQRHSALDYWYRTPHTHEQLAVNGRSVRSDRMWEREREMEWRRAEERRNK